MATLNTALMLLSAAMAGDVANNSTAAGDLGRLQGRWEAKAGPNGAFPVALDIQGHQVSVRVALPAGLQIHARGEIMLDEGATPKSLDWVKFTGEDDQVYPEILAIYRLDGDELTVCNGGPNNDRPVEFKPGEGSLAEVMKFHRVKIQASEPATPESPAPVVSPGGSARPVAVAAPPAAIQPVMVPPVVRGQVVVLRPRSRVRAARPWRARRQLARMARAR